MKARPWVFIGLASSVLLAACGRSGSAGSDHDHAAHAEGGEESDSGVTFVEGQGLRLSPEVGAALGLRTVVVQHQTLAPDSVITAQVFAVKPRILATARLAADRVESIRHASFVDAALVRIDDSAADATRLVDAVFELTNPVPHQPGEFVSIALHGAAADVLAVPRSAILDGATDSFVYVVAAGVFRRIPVRLGARNAGFVEVTGGLQAGDVIVAAPVEQLWLAELRLTKGGGHSH